MFFHTILTINFQQIKLIRIKALFKHTWVFSNIYFTCVFIFYRQFIKSPLWRYSEISFHIQLHMQAARPHQELVKPRGGDMISKCKDTSANQKLEEKAFNGSNGSATTMAQCWVELYLLTNNEAELLLIIPPNNKANKMHRNTLWRLSSSV